MNPLKRLLVAVGAAALASGLAGAVVASPAAAAKGGNKATVQQCKAKVLTGAFRNLGQCVSAANQATAPGAPRLDVNCPTDNLQTALSAAPPGSTLDVHGTCTGPFTIVNGMRLVGPATLDGGGAGPVVTVKLAATEGTTLADLTIQHGATSDGGAGIFNESDDLTINNTQVSDNTATGSGGGIFNSGVVTLNSSQVLHNTSSQGSGGGIANLDGLTVLNDSLVSDNTALFGGGIDNAGNTVTLSNTVVANNSARLGGGIFNTGTVNLRKSSGVADNTASTDGGGIYNQGSVNLLESSVVVDNNPNDCAPPNSVQGCGV